MSKASHNKIDIRGPQTPKSNSKDTEIFTLSLVHFPLSVMEHFGH